MSFERLRQWKGKFAQAVPFYNTVDRVWMQESSSTCSTCDTWLFVRCVSRGCTVCTRMCGWLEVRMWVCETIKVQSGGDNGWMNEWTMFVCECRCPSVLHSLTEERIITHCGLLWHYRKWWGTQSSTRMEDAYNREGVIMLHSHLQFQVI